MVAADQPGPVAGLEGPAHVLVTGASSGIGLAMMRQLLDNAQVGFVAAVSRSATRNGTLQALQAADPGRLMVVDADLTVEGDLALLSDALARRIDRLHLVVNTAGVLHAHGLSPEKVLEQVSLASLQRVFAINAFAPILLAQALLPLLGHGAPAVFASLSARVGSIGDNRSGGWYAYRASKAAQNQLLKTLSIEMARRNRRSCCVLLHPGTVDTPLSAPYQARVPREKLFAAERAARQLLDIIARCTPVQSGRFLAWDGSEVPW
ncbi:SDR family NAD(P)-dependent oxidoreductase [Dokdonella immobilis]|uniref:NAD(P)-dependent dehydrogenase, short-chain alcohol dehydrogenase family n=1 Tax=Dokdonella immobilis TaxID=578942 RepID=A0A1I4XP59_9GAMM|nr:SDR family NAD(P)-dependent oxidoreductase [Dokdonella immobilis]SFN27615.1 NAD(P)-dependent dehydrogenase, short-chain alcohol dehydrogenase family [Dokdonella immobilis]